MNNSDPLMTMQEAGDYLGVSARLVQNLIAREELRGTFVGRLVRVRRSDLENYLSQPATSVRR